MVAHVEDKRAAASKLPARRLLNSALLYLTVAVVSLIIVFPVYWMMISTFQPSKYILHFPPPLLPQELYFDQFGELFNEHPIAKWLRNSFLIAVMTMLLCMALSVLGAFALSNLRWPGRNLFGLFLLVTQMLPEVLILIPLFILPICIWILKGVFDNVPPEVLDASVVDGCTELGALWRIVLPLSAPGLAAVAVVAFFFAWNEYLYAGIMLSSGDFMPASVGLSTLKAIAQTPVEQYMAAGLVFSVLPVVFYLAMQRYIVSGLTADAVKG